MEPRSETSLPVRRDTSESATTASVSNDLFGNVSIRAWSLSSPPRTNSRIRPEAAPGMSSVDADPVLWSC